jgi:type I restriction enzyme M protein
MGLPPKSKGDYAFIEHMLASLNENGTAGIILPHGVLFRAASEGKIRKQIIENNWLDAVIGLPENLFFGTPIPTCMIIFKKNKSNTNVLFIDASNDFVKDVNQYKLTDDQIEKIVKTYRERKEIDKYAHVATLEEIKDNDYNLNISRYIDMFEEEEYIDINKLKQEMNEIEIEIKNVKEDMHKCLQEIGL